MKALSYHEARYLVGKEIEWIIYGPNMNFIHKEVCRIVTVSNVLVTTSKILSQAVLVDGFFHLPWNSNCIYFKLIS